MEDDPGDKIADNPTAKRMLTMLPLVRVLACAAGLVGKVGIKPEEMAKIKSAADEVMSRVGILELPDRFNAAFAAQGWVATGAFAAGVMQRAVELHESGQLEEAEKAILGWFTEGNIRLFAITRARRFHAAHLRDEQLEEALRLYLEERYMAAVPLILVASDGFASDVSGVSPFEKNADLTCFDSVTGHQTSLPALMKLFIQGVRKSTDAELSIPKRHGILHGRSLGYANKVVCAKAWLLMVALVDWAIDKSSEDARIEERRKKENTSLRDELEQLQRTQNDKKVIEAFQPSESIGPIAGAYDVDTPEHAVREFLEGWKKKNFGRMAKHAVNLTRKPLSQMAGEIRDAAELVVLEDYEVVRVRHSSVARCDMRVRVRAQTRKKPVAGAVDLIVLRYAADGNVAMPSDQDCHWAVQQNCIYSVMHEQFSSQP